MADNYKYNILYVDDEEQNLISFRAAYRRHHNIFTALSGAEGIDVLRHNNIHLIITDQRMPEMTGIQFLEKIVPEFPETIRMILTGFTDIEAIIDAINTGRVLRYITKPWDERELKITIDNALHIFQLQLNNKDLVSELKQRVLDQEKTLRLFQKYVPKSVVEKALSAQEESAIFEGELREVSVMFCDLRNFTRMSSMLAPKEVVTLLNSFYSLMSESIKKYNGSVNQYVGDEIFAIFGAPLTYPEDHSNAVFCAMDMLLKLDELNKNFSEKINGKIEVGIGINTGEVVAGNLGSEEKIEYSIAGDIVNIGKRIESLTKELPNTILISQSNYDKVKDLINVKPWEPVNVKGKKDKIQVYEVLGRK